MGQGGSKSNKGGDNDQSRKMSEATARPEPYKTLEEAWEDMDGPIER